MDLFCFLFFLSFCSIRFLLLFIQIWLTSVVLSMLNHKKNGKEKRRHENESGYRTQKRISHTNRTIFSRVECRFPMLAIDAYKKRDLGYKTTLRIDSIFSWFRTIVAAHYCIDIFMVRAKEPSLIKIKLCFVAD